MVPWCCETKEKIDEKPEPDAQKMIQEDIGTVRSRARR
jgi:hypothetical protein